MTFSQQQLDEALSMYTLASSEAALIRHNENVTYKVTDKSAEKAYLLRIHCPVEGFSLGILRRDENSVTAVLDELEIISALKAGTDISVQAPIKNKKGELVSVLQDGTPVSLLEWVDGETLEQPLLTPEILWQVGKMVGDLHRYFISHKITYPSRYRYDETLLPFITTQIELAVRCEALSDQQGNTIKRTIDEIDRRFKELDKTEPRCLVHADLSKSNMILNTDGRITPIDFSLCGYSHPHMDLGSLFAHFEKPEERKSLIDGYNTSRPCEILPYFLEPYFAIQVILMVACQYERVKAWDWFPESMDRWCRTIFTPLVDKETFLFIG